MILVIVYSDLLYQFNMGSHLCGQDTHEKDINIFEYRYAEDDKEIKI